MRSITALLFVALLSIGALAADAKPKYIGMKRAKAIARQHVKGTITSAELEKEHGRMIYSFDMRTAKGRITEVEINATTGAVLRVGRETAAEEAKEKDADKEGRKH